MIIFYDFDGTLTPYPVPKYEILNKCNVDSTAFFNQVLELTDKMHMSVYDAFFDVFKNILMNNGLKFNKETICTGADNVKLNEGVLDFLKAFHNIGIKQYVITSGFGDYIKKTPVAMYIEGIVGTEFKDDNEDGILDKILTDVDKVEAIKSICAKENIPYDKAVYLGDGLTDKKAFAFIHQNEGKAIFIGGENDEYETLNSYHLLDKAFPRDFTLESDLYNYIMSLYNSKEV